VNQNQKGNKLKIATIFLILLFNTSIWSQSVEDIVEEIQDRYEDLENFAANFVQVEQFLVTGAKNEISGQIYVKGGVKYRLETEDRTIVTDGITVWTYSVFNNQVLIDRAKKDDGAMLPRDLIFKYPQEYYAVLLDEVMYKDEDHYILKLDPKEDTHGFIKSMKIWVNGDNYLISKIEYTDFNDNTSLFEIKKIITNKSLSDSFFEFQAPEGADIIDLRL
jgi:chaperone LolA